MRPSSASKDSLGIIANHRADDDDAVKSQRSLLPCQHAGHPGSILKNRTSHNCQNGILSRNEFTATDVNDPDRFMEYPVEGALHMGETNFAMFLDDVTDGSDADLAGLQQSKLEIYGSISSLCSEDSSTCSDTNLVKESSDDVMESRI